MQCVVICCPSPSHSLQLNYNNMTHSNYDSHLGRTDHARRRRSQRGRKGGPSTQSLYRAIRLRRCGPGFESRRLAITVAPAVLAPSAWHSADVTLVREHVSATPRRAANL